MDALFVKAPLRSIAGLVLLVYCCRGQSQLIGPHEPIVARVGDDVILPCHLDPAVDVVGRTLEWSRSDRNSMFVYVWRSNQEFEKAKHSSYVGRTSLFIDQLSHGNISLKLSNLKLSDRGTYRCFIVDDKKQTFAQLIVAPDSVALPVISLAALDKSSSSVELECESAGWYPEPEVLWLDGDGNLLSAGPTETIRGPDDLYTVSSRVTVEKKHGNKFTCRVQQNNINQSREDLIHVPDDFFLIPCSSAVPIIVGFSVSLAVSIILNLGSVFFLCRRNRTKTKRTLDKTEKEGKKNCSQTEAKLLMPHEDVEMQLKEAQEEANRRWKEANEIRKESKIQLEEKDAEISKLRGELDNKIWEEKQKKEKDLKESDGSKSEDVDHQMESKQQNSSSSDHHTDLSDIILDEVHDQGKYLRLKNTSTEEKLLRGCKLQLFINNKELFIYTFDQSFTVKAGGKITFWCSSGSGCHDPTNGNLVWKDLKPLKRGDKLQLILFNQTGEFKILSN